MSSDKAAASKQTTDDSTVGAGVGHGEISDANTKVLSGHPDGESGTSSSNEGGDHDSAAAEHGTHYHPRGPPNRPAHGGPKIIKR